MIDLSLILIKSGSGLISQCVTFVYDVGMNVRVYVRTYVCTYTIVLLLFSMLLLKGAQRFGARPISFAAWPS